ncbi:unnamed protein product, partial [Chrysoparadoxa australica]
RDILRSCPGVLRQCDTLVSALKRRQISGPYNCAKCTMDLLKKFIGDVKWGTAGALIELIKMVGRELQLAKPTELAVGNVVRRVLFIVREEYASYQCGITGLYHQLIFEFSKRSFVCSFCSKLSAVEVAAPSLETVLGGEVGEASYDVVITELKQIIIEGVQELCTELEEVNNVICEHAADTIHANEVILTLGYSRTVFEFLVAAAEHYRKLHLTFSVIVAEAAPFLRGQVMAKDLAKKGIETTVISDAAVFAIMARVNKVIMPTHAVVANGGSLIAMSGSHTMTLAAKELSVPVVCVTGLFKLTPLFSHDQHTFNCLLTPSAVMSYQENDAMPTVEVLNPAYDYIPPHLVDLYITNIGAHQPSYIYRLLAEYYHRDDHFLTPLEG